MHMKPESAVNPRVMTMAHDLYAAYNASCSGKNYQGLPCPLWRDLTPAVRGHWYTVALRALEIGPVDHVFRDGRVGHDNLFSLNHLPDPEAAHATWSVYAAGNSLADIRPIVDGA